LERSATTCCRSTICQLFQVTTRQTLERHGRLKLLASWSVNIQVQVQVQVWVGIYFASLPILLPFTSFFSSTLIPLLNAGRVYGACEFPDMFRRSPTHKLDLAHGRESEYFSYFNESIIVCLVFVTCPVTASSMLYTRNLRVYNLDEAILP